MSALRRKRTRGLLFNINEYQRLARTSDHESVGVQALHFLASIQRELGHAKQETALSILVNVEATTTGILNKDATYILHWPAPMRTIRRWQSVQIAN